MRSTSLNPSTQENNIRVGTQPHRHEFGPLQHASQRESRMYGIKGVLSKHAKQHQMKQVRQNKLVKPYTTWHETWAVQSLRHILYDNSSPRSVYVHICRSHASTLINFPSAAGRSVSPCCRINLDLLMHPTPGRDARKACIPAFRTAPPMELSHISNMYSSLHCTSPLNFTYPLHIQHQPNNHDRPRHLPQTSAVTQPSPIRLHG